MGGGVSTHHTDWHLLRFPWKCLLRQKNSIALENQSLLCQAESLDGRTISGMPRMANLGICP